MRNERKAGAVLSYINIFLNTAIMLVYTPFVLRVLGQSEYGLFTLGMSIIAYLGIFDFGFGNTIVVFTAKFIATKNFDGEKKLHSTVFGAYLFISLLSFIAGIILYFNLDKIFGNSLSLAELEKLKIITIVVIISLIINFPLSIYRSILNAYEKFVFIKFLSISRSILNPILFLPFLFLGFGSVAMIIIVAFINVAILVVEFIYCRLKIKPNINLKMFDLNVLKKVFNYSIWIFLGMVVDQVNWNLGNFIIGASLGTKEVAVYGIALLISSTFMVLSTAISGVLLPKVSAMVANNASSEILTNEMIKTGRIQHYILFLVLTGFILFGKEFIVIWAGKGYVDAYYLTLIIMVPLMVPLIQNLGLSIMQAKNLYWFKTSTTFVGAVFSAIFSFILVKFYGYFGVAFCTGIAFIIFNGIVINIFYKQKLKLNILKFWTNIFKISLAPFMLFLIMFVFKNLSENLIYIAFLCFAYMFFYSLICLKFSMNDYEKTIVFSVINKIRGKI